MSKALEALEKIKLAPTIYCGCGSDIYTRFSFECKEIEKSLKAFEIIKEKDVNIGLLKSVLHADKSLHTASYYNSHFVATYRHLTQEEFDSLKEVLR